MSEDDYAEGGAGEAGGTPTKKKGPLFPGQKLKRLIQTDESVGKISKSALVAVGRSVELFLAGEGGQCTK